MGIPELIITAIALSMDAFAVSICKGLAMKKVSIKEMAIVGLWFGGFQALMPLIGYFLGSAFEKYIIQINPRSPNRGRIIITRIIRIAESTTDVRNVNFCWSSPFSIPSQTLSRYINGTMGERAHIRKPTVSFL